MITVMFVVFGGWGLGGEKKKKINLDDHELCSITPEIHSCLPVGNNF